MPTRVRFLALTALSHVGCATTDTQPNEAAMAATTPTNSAAGGATSTGDPESTAPPSVGTPSGTSSSAPGNTTPSTGGNGPVDPGAGGAPTSEGTNSGPSVVIQCVAECVDDCAAVLGEPAPGECSAGTVCCSLPVTMNGGSGGAAASTGGGAGIAGSSAGGVSTGAGGASGGTSAGPVYDYAADVESTSADCEVAELPEPGGLPTISDLPDPFTKLDGTRIASKSEWRCRRQEIIEQAKKYVYGDKPTPDSVSGTVTENAIDVHVEAMGTAIDFSARVVLPSSGEAPYPAIINIGSNGMTLGESRVLEQGVAVIYYDHYDLGEEGAPEASRGLPNPGLFYDIYGGDHSAGLLMAWAWGASRLIDVLQQSDQSLIDVGSLGVTGCSRNGKGAFAVGVFDERIALTIPHETSTAGVPVYRLVDILNTERTDHNYYGLNWFSNNFEPFVYANNTSNVVKLPIDTHELVALVAPRGLLVLDNPHQTQMSAPAGHLATVSGAEVYEALGVLDHVSYHSSVAQMPHCSYKDEYTDLLTRNIARFLKHEDAETGDFIVGQGGDGMPGEWIDWETPTLTE